jgi:hypothetical protein
LSAAPFEGIARYKLLGKQAKEGRELEFAIKGDKFRMDVKARGQQVAVIMDTKARQNITLLPDRKAYVVMKLDAHYKPGKAAGKLVKTGKTETIAGYLAEEWAYEGPDNKITLWGTKALGSWALNGGVHTGGPDLEVPAEFKDGGFFLLRMVHENGGMEAIKVEKTSLPKELFEVPAGYEAMDMGAMMYGKPTGAMTASEQKAMTERMKKMTPEQRKMMEKMLKGK